MIAERLGLPRSTVGAVLRRLGLGRRASLDAKPPVVRYPRERPGELIHLDIKTLGKIDGVGHRITGHHAGHHRARGVGHEHLHVAIDDASRLAYTGSPDDLFKTARQAGSVHSRTGSPLRRQGGGEFCHPRDRTWRAVPRRAAFSDVVGRLVRPTHGDVAIVRDNRRLGAGQDGGYMLVRGPGVPD